MVKGLKKRWEIGCLYLLFLFVAMPANAVNFSEQFFDPDDGMLDASQWLSENAYGFLPMPIIITEPALGTGGGLVGMFFHESDKAREQRLASAQKAENAAAYLLPPSVTAVAVAGTSNKTWLAGAGHMGFLAARSDALFGLRQLFSR